jgi:hypothetical protein
MRMEEILQLGPEDFGTDNGIPYLRVRHTIINGVKTLSSARTLPIHPQLVELGLLKLVELRRKEGNIRLFPFLERGKQKGTFSANFSKKFGYYRRTNDCYGPGLGFHALRTTFHHDLLGDDKSDAIRCRLMGRTYTDEGDRSYGQNLKIEKLAERMKSVVVDISMIRKVLRRRKEGAVMTITNPAELDGLKVIGRIVANTLRDMAATMEPCMTTTELDEIGRDLLERDGAVSAPGSTYGFPGTTCISLHEEIAHGIPGDHVIGRGDLVNIDVSASRNGYSPAPMRATSRRRTIRQMIVCAATAGAPCRSASPRSGPANCWRRSARRSGGSLRDGATRVSGTLRATASSDPSRNIQARSRSGRTAVRAAA